MPHLVNSTSVNGRVARRHLLELSEVGHKRGGEKRGKQAVHLL